MPVTFCGEQEEKSVYIDPAFRYDSQPRIGQGQCQDVAVTDRASKNNTQVNKPTSECKRSYSRSGTLDNQINNTDDQILFLNISGDDGACHNTKTTDSRDDDKCHVSLEHNSLRLPRQQRENSRPAYEDEVNERDYLAHKAFYTTSTQKLYQGVDWCDRITRPVTPPNTSKEVNADTVSFRYESKRYEPQKENWQRIGSKPFSWDYAQTRDGHRVPRPISFCSPHKKNAHIPGYTGHVSNEHGELENPHSPDHSSSKQRVLKPRYTDTSRKGNIPGYTGCVQFCNNRPACQDDPDYLRSTTESTYRPHDEVQCNERSPFKRSSSMSRLVTLTHPFNPFNKVY